MSKKFNPGFGPSQDDRSPSPPLWTPLPSKAYGPSGGFKREFEEKTFKEAKEKALLIQKEAYEKGFAQGERDGLELGKRKVEAVAHQIENLLAAIEGQKEDLFKAYEKDMVRLVLSIARKVLHRELETKEGAILETLREAFRSVSNQRKAVAHVNPVDYQYLSSHLQESPCSVKMVEDPLSTRGGCLLETPFGDTDATIEGQFDEIASAIWKQFEPSKNSAAL